VFLDVFDLVLDLALEAILLALDTLRRTLGFQFVVADGGADFFLGLAYRFLDVALGLVGGGAMRRFLGESARVHRPCRP
jgi:hypothetical protein